MSDRSRLRQQTPGRGVSNEEMDQRIHALAERVGIGGPLTVRHIQPRSAAGELAAARAAVLTALRAAEPTTAGQIADATGLPQPTVSNALRALLNQGMVTVAGTKNLGHGGRQRLWVLRTMSAG